MKNKLWIIAIIAIIGLLMAACEEPADVPPGSEGNPIPLTENTWKQGSLPDSESKTWYSFEVESDTTYYIWVKERFTSPAGSHTSYADVMLTAKYKDGAIIFENSESGTDASTAATSNRPASNFDASKNGTVLVRVFPATGTIPTYGEFKVAFTTVDSRPSGE